ncbi:MAG: hypothetical protein MK165_21355, partial [Pirellulaceae bacterium]|nr:hypothetical protein [Pirellulaceae bacterium]
GGPPVFQKGMAINSNGTVFLSGGLGVPYTASPGGNIQDGTSVWAMDHAAGTVDDYVDLAFATGGMAGDIDIISGYGTDSYASASGDSFADVLSTQITWQTIQKNPHRGALAEVVDKTLKGKLWFSSQAAKWEVYATGDAGNSNGIWSATNPPTISEINQHIANANNVSNIPGTSKGWIDEQGHVRAGNGAPSSNYSIGSNGKLVTGEQNNSNTGYFNIVSPLNQHTRWMWYNPDPVNVTKPFEYGPASNGQNDGSREFLIFRLKVRDLVPTRRSSDAPKARPSRGDLTRVNPPRSNSPRPKPPRTKPPRTERPKTNLPRDERPGGRPQGRPTGRPLSDPKRVTTESDRTKPSKTGRPTSGRPLNGPAVDRPRGVDRQAVSQPTPPAKPAKGKKGLRKPLGKPTDNDLNQAATDKKRLPPKPDKKKQAAGKEEKAKPLAKAPATPSVLLKK